MASSWRKASEWIFVNALAALACGLGALIGLALGYGTPSPAQNWPVVGLGLVAARFLGPRCFAGIWLVSFLTVDLAVVDPGVRFSSFVLQLLISGIFMGQTVLAAQLLRLPPGENPLDTRRGVFRLLIAGLIAAFAGSTLRLLIGWFLELSNVEIFTRFAYRVSKFVSGVLLVAPLAFMIGYEGRPRFSRALWAELVALLAVLAFATLLASTDLVRFFQAYQQMLILLVLPLTLWVSLRAGSWGGPLSVFVASIIPIWGTLRGFSAFGGPASIASEILTHLYLVAVSITTLTVGAVLKERSNAVKELEEAKTDLEEKVENRTEDLRHERDFGSAIFDSIGALVFVHRPDGRIVRLNRTSQEYIGKTPEEVAGKYYWDLGIIPDEEMEMVQRRLQDTNPVGENHMIAHDGTRRLFQWTNTRLEGRTNSNGDFIISIGIDITERRRAEEEALEAIKARDLFLSVASHELRTPLTTLQLQLQSLQRFVDRLGDLPKEIPSRLGLALRQTRRLGDLINELLDVSRITHGRLAPERTEVDLAKVVQEVVDRYRISLEQSGSELVTRGLDEEIRGFWDPLRVDQVVDNLLSNAIKYGEGKPIEMEIDVVDDCARIVVTDHGIGISPSDQKRIFDRFERAVSTRYYGGFGLGLWITRQVVEAHGGTIRVESELDQGSTFTVDLPLCAP